MTDRQPATDEQLQEWLSKAPTRQELEWWQCIIARIDQERERGDSLQASLLKKTKDIVRACGSQYNDTRWTTVAVVRDVVKRAERAEAALEAIGADASPGSDYTPYSQLAVELAEAKAGNAHRHLLYRARVGELERMLRECCQWMLEHNCLTRLGSVYDDAKQLLEKKVEG